MEFAPQRNAHLALRCRRRPCSSIRARGEGCRVRDAMTFDTGVCHMALFRRPGRQRSHAPPALRARYGEQADFGAFRVWLAALLERYRALPLPTTTRRALALHRPRGLRSRRVRRRSPPVSAPGAPRCSSSTRPVPRSQARPASRSRTSPRESRSHRSPTTSCSARSSDWTTSSPPRTRRSGSTVCSCTCRRESRSRSPSTCVSRARPTAARSSGACSSSPRKAAGSP